MFAAAVVVGVLGHLLVPQLLVWLLVVMLIWAAGTAWFRTVDPGKGRFRTLRHAQAGQRPLKDGESYDTAVKLTWAPNVPTAEALCTHLHTNGIEAFYKRAPDVGIFSTTSDLVPAEVWVPSGKLDRARGLLPPT
jgi:hypothetical protein